MRRHAQEERVERRRRVLSERPVDPHKIYDYLEAQQAERSKVQRHRFLLTNGFLPPEENEPRILELPESHALSWVHEMVGDWHSVFDEASRLREVVARRLEARRTGTSHAESVRKHKTGIEWLDHERYTKPSAVGEAMRRLWHRTAHKGEDPPWHHRNVGQRVARRLDDREHGKLRRLAEAFLEGTISAPFAFSDTVLPSGTVIEGSRVSFWEASLRYLLSSTIGCYFVKPTQQRSDTQGDDAGDQGDDGDALKVLRPSAEKLCFPAVIIYNRTFLVLPAFTFLCIALRYSADGNSFQWGGQNRLQYTSSSSEGNVTHVHFSADKLCFPARTDPIRASNDADLSPDHQHRGRRPEVAQL
tara:strand:+ start:6 stop:1082 length:1077 start_codon:yes stop_codon:yes gene_type:complete